MKYFTTEQLSGRKQLTPEGFLLCQDAVIARVGKLAYTYDEISDVGKDRDGLVYLFRDSNELGAQNTVASFNGKPVTNEHPRDFVSPDDYKSLTVGTVQNVRFKDSFLIADLLICDKQAIKAVLNGKVELSAGYSGDVEKITDGHGRLVNICGNHVALVHKGRCGPVCAIRDNTPKVHDMRLFNLLKKADNLDTVRLIADEMESEEQQEMENKRFAKLEEMVNTLSERLSSLEERISQKVTDEEEEKEEEDEGEEQEKMKADTLKNVIAAASKINPNLKFSDTVPDGMDIESYTCLIRRQVIASSDGFASIVQEITGKRNIFDSARHDVVRVFDVLDALATREVNGQTDVLLNIGSAPPVTTKRRTPYADQVNNFWSSR